MVDANALWKWLTINWSEGLMPNVFLESLSAYKPGGYGNKLMLGCTEVSNSVNT